MMESKQSRLQARSDAGGLGRLRSQWMARSVTPVDIQAATRLSVQVDMLRDIVAFMLVSNVTML